MGKRTGEEEGIGGGGEGSRDVDGEEGEGGIGNGVDSGREERVIHGKRRGSSCSLVAL